MQYFTKTHHELSWKIIMLPTQSIYVVSQQFKNNVLLAHRSQSSGFRNANVLNNKESTLSLETKLDRHLKTLVANVA